MEGKFPEEFKGLSKDCIERLWDEYLDVGNGVYLNRDEFRKIFGIIDDQVALFTEANNESPALHTLFTLFELPVSTKKEDGEWVDGVEVFGAIILSSNQISRREKLLLLRDRCFFFSPMNIASVINGASIALDGMRSVRTDEEITEQSTRELEPYLDKFRHRKVNISVQIKETGLDVDQDQLKIVVPGSGSGSVQSFNREDGTALVFAEGGARATIGAWELKLNSGIHTLKGRTGKQASLVVCVKELDGLTETGEEKEDEKPKQEGDPDDSDLSEQEEETDHQVDLKISQQQSIIPGVLAGLVGYNTEIGAQQISTGELVYVTGRYVVIENTNDKERRICALHDNSITSLLVHPNAKLIFSAQVESGKILVWDSKTLQLMYSVNTIARGSKFMRVSKCGKTLFVLSGSRDRTYGFYDISHLDQLTVIHTGRLHVSLGDVLVMEMLNKEQVMLCGTHVSRLASNGEITRLRWGKVAPHGLQNGMCVMTGNVCVTSSTNTKSVYLWANDTCTKHHTFESDASITSLLVGNGNISGNILCGMSNGTLELISTRTLEPVKHKNDESVDLQGNSIVFLANALSGILLATGNGSLYLHRPGSNDALNILKNGHGAGVESLLWCWCGTEKLATSRRNRELRIWNIKKNPDNSATVSLDYSLDSLSAHLTALTGDNRYLFMALQGRKIKILDLEQKGESIPQITCSLPVVDAIAASNNLVAACCTSARKIEIFSLPSGRLASKLNITSNQASTRFLFVKNDKGDLFLNYGDSNYWDMRTWKSGESNNISELGELLEPKVPFEVYSLDGSLQLMRMNPPRTEQEEKFPCFKPAFHRGVRAIPNKSEANSKADKNSVIAVNGKGVLAVAVHPDWNLGIAAIATYIPFVDVNGFKLHTSVPAQALCFDDKTCMAVATASSLILFDWTCGAKIGFAFLDSSTSTLSLAFSKGVNDNGLQLFRVTCHGSLEAWILNEDCLILIKSNDQCQATCVTPSGYYGTCDGSIFSIRHGNSKIISHGSAAISDLYEDRDGFVSASVDGTIRHWTPTFQPSSYRYTTEKQDEVKTDPKIITSVWRHPFSKEIIHQTSDGVVFRNSVKEPLDNINLGMPKSYVPASFYNNISKEDPTSNRQFSFKLRNSTDKIQLTNDTVTSFGSNTATFKLDSFAKHAAISNNEKLLAVSSVRNDLYIIDVSTCILMFFWPNSMVISRVNNLKFEEHNSKLKDDTLVFEKLLINDQVFNYKT